MSAGTAAQNSGPTAQTTNLNNKKPFSYEQYVARKRGIQHALEIKSKKWNLPKNFAKFELQEKTNLSTRDLLNLVINAIGKDNESSIKSFSPGQTSSCWLIAFDSKETKERILHSSPTIMDQIKIVDANEKCPPPVVTCNGKFRLHKLPPYTQLATIEDYLKNKIKIKSFSYKNIQKEKYKDTNIENGIVSFQMSYSLEDHSQVQALIGANFITNEIRAFFQLCGHQSKCNICKDFGHHSKNCPRKDLKCDNCKGRGHANADCNFANRAKYAFDDMDDYDDVDENIEENNRNVEENKSTYNLETSNPNHSNETIGAMINQINQNNQTKSITPANSETSAQKSTNLPPPPPFNPSQPPAAQHPNITTSTPNNQTQIKRHYASEYFKKTEDSQSSNESSASPPLTSNSKKQNKNVSNHE